MTPVFEQRERWLEELSEYVMRAEEPILCEAGYMTLPAITAEIIEAATDPRKHDGQQKNDWMSRGRDLHDSQNWIGPHLRAMVCGAATALHQAITTYLLTSASGKIKVDDSKRPLVATRAETLMVLLDRGETVAAAWRDLVAACQSTDHVEYPTDRVKYLRDTVVALAALRRLDPGPFGPVQTAAKVLSGYRHDVDRARHILGEATPAWDLEDIGSRSELTRSELEDLAARSVAVESDRGDYVVWFRITSAYVKGGYCVRSGDVTFYQGTRLANALTNHAAARELSEYVPEELFTEDLLQIQLSDEGPSETRGFEWTDPMLVYARVELRDIEMHRAVARARTHLDAVIEVSEPDKNTWRVLRGSLLLGEKIRYHYHLYHWGLKEEQVFTNLLYDNDHVTERLIDVTADGHAITPDSAVALIPVLRLQRELANAPDSDPEAVVRAAVRVIEHCNTWTELERMGWGDFLAKYLLDPYTVETFAHRVVAGVFDAAVKYLPDHTPGAPPQPELDAIREDISPDGLGRRIIRDRILPHIAALRRIYADHWLARRLAELEDTLASADSLSRAFNEEHSRVQARVDRLRRQRNAAIHGGTLSVPACETIAHFARRIAHAALYNVVRAKIDGLEVAVHTKDRRDVYRQRAENLTTQGDLRSLFLPIPPGTLGASKPGEAT